MTPSRSLPLLVTAVIAARLVGDSYAVARSSRLEREMANGAQLPNTAGE